MTVVTVTGHGAAATQLARRLADALGVQLVDSDELRQLPPGRVHLALDGCSPRRESLAARVSRACVRYLELVGACGDLESGFVGWPSAVTIEAYDRARWPSPDAGIDALFALLERCAFRGDAVIAVPGAQAALGRSSGAVHILAHADGESDLDDRARAAWYHRNFGIDWQDPRHYDAVVNLDRLPLECALAEVFALVSCHRALEGSWDIGVAV